MISGFLRRLEICNHLLSAAKRALLIATCVRMLAAELERVLTKFTGEEVELKQLELKSELEILSKSLSSLLPGT